MRPLLRAVALALTACACSPLSHKIGSKAAEGAVQQVQKEMESRPQEEQGRIAETAGRGAVRGMLAELSTPEVRETTKRIADDISSEMIHQLKAQFGAQGSGPLADALAATTERMSAAAAGAAIGEVSSFAAGCSDADPQRCLERQARKLGAAAGAGLIEALRVPFALLCFGLGFACCLVLVLVVSHPRLKRPGALSLHRKHA